MAISLDPCGPMSGQGRVDIEMIPRNKVNSHVM